MVYNLIEEENNLFNKIENFAAYELQLAKLKNAGFNVPDFFVIPSTIIQQY